MGSVETVFSIIILVLLGYALKFSGVLKKEDASSLNRIVINVAIPSLIFRSLYTSDLSGIGQLVIIPAICMIIGTLSGFLAFLWARYRFSENKKIWSLVIPAAMMNSGFLGYPVNLGLFGSEGLLRAIFFDTGNILMLILLGMLLAVNSGGDKRRVLKKAFMFPPLWAFILGLSFSTARIPIGITGTVIEYLAGAAVPLIMISLGLTLNFRFLKESITDAAFVSTLRLIISPIMAIMIVYALSFNYLNSSVTVIEASMPSAMLAGVLAIDYELDVNLTSACIFMSTALSLISIPIWSIII